MIYYQIKDSQGIIYKICCKIIIRKSLFIVNTPIYRQDANSGYIYRDFHGFTTLRLGAMNMHYDKHIYLYCYSLRQFIKALKLCK